MRFSLFTAFVLFLIAAPASAVSGAYIKFRNQMQLAEAEHASGDFNSAIKIYRRVYAKSQLFRPEALDKLVSIYKETKDINSALDLVKEDIADYPFSIKSRLYLINLLEQKGDLLSALDEAKRAEKISAADENILDLKYKIHKKLANDAEAIVTLNELIKIRPTNATALLARAKLYYSLKKFKKAFRDLQKAYTLRPYDELILTEYVKTSLYTKNYWIVDHLGKKCLKHFPTNESCLVSIGRMQFDKKSYHQAVAYFSKALAIDQSNIDNRILFAEALSFDHRSAESYAEYKKILTLIPDSEKTMKSWFAQLSRIKDFQILGNEIKSFCAENPDNIWAAYEYAKLLLTVDAKKQAIAVIKRMNKSVNSEVSMTYYAYVLYLTGEYQKSLEVLENISEPKFQNSFNKGIVSYKAGHEKDAEKHWKQNLGDDQVSNFSRSNLALLDKKNKTKELRGPANEDQFYLHWELPEL